MKRSVVRRLSLTPLALGALGALGGAACSSSESAATSTRKPALQAAPAAAPAVAPVTVLRGSLHPSARPERDLGRMDPATPLPNLALLLGRSPAVKRRLVHDQVAIQDPMSPDYHRWLSPEEYGARYGASSADVARASAWLAAHGFHVDGPSVTGSRLSFSGSVGQVESAFNTEVHRYQVGGERHFALSREPQVPADLGTVVAGLHGTHDFRPAPPRTRKTPASPRGKFGGQYALSPADFATIYDINPLYSANITGKGQKIAIVGESYYNPSDVLAFRQNFGLDTTNMPTDVLVPNTGTSMVLDGGDLSESELDMEWSGGIAKDASVYFVYTGDNPTSYGFFDAMLYAVETRVAPIVSGEGKMASYDYWAVGVNCCKGGMYRCGEYNNPKAKNGVRLMDDTQRSYFKSWAQRWDGRGCHHWRVPPQTPDGKYAPVLPHSRIS